MLRLRHRVIKAETKFSNVYATSSNFVDWSGLAEGNQKAMAHTELFLQEERR